MACKLDLPPSSKIHPVFYVSQLKRVVGSSSVSPTSPPKLSPDLQRITTPERLLDVHTQIRGQLVYIEVLIKWINLPEFEVTWEDMEVIKEQFPNFHLEDKVRLWVGVHRPQPGLLL